MSEKILPYDEKDPESIEAYTKKLIGKTFYEVLEQTYNGQQLEEFKKYYDNPKSKGSLGNLIEEHYFFYSPNSNSEPDFVEAKTELKVTPYEITTNKKGTHYKAGERLVIGMISNQEPIEPDFFKSHLFYKMKTMLLVFYLRNKKLARTDYQIDFVKLFSIVSKECEEDLAIIVEDYKIIADKIMAGKAHELSESDTNYLGACTKGANAKQMLQPQYYNKDIPAKRRAFSLKTSYMTYVINRYVLNEIPTYDSIQKDESYNGNLDEYILHKIQAHVGKSEAQLYQQFDLTKNAKNNNNLAVCRMLGVKTDKVEEFEKANIVIKTIRVKRNGLPKESMSFQHLIIKEFVQEEFEDSWFYNYFSETRFLFVVFHENEQGTYILRGAKFWNMPTKDLEGVGYEEWLANQQKFKDGIHFHFTTDRNNKLIVQNDLPKSQNTEILHLRPHASHASYVIDGIVYGSGNEADMDTLLNNDKMTKQSFWLNNTYIAKIISDIK